MLSKFFSTFSFDSPGYQFMWIILVIGVFAIAIVIERGIYLWVRSNVNADKFMGEIRKLVSAGDFKKAIALCRSAGKKALPQVVLAALLEAERKEIVDFRAVQNAVDEAALEIIPRLGRRIGFLAVIGNIATLTGLMGTIFGLIISFEAASAAGAGASMLAQGISIAMFTTLWGLVIAIPSLIFYTLMNAKSQNLIDDIDEHSVKIIHLLTGNR